MKKSLSLLIFFIVNANAQVPILSLEYDSNCKLSAEIFMSKQNLKVNDNFTPYFFASGGNYNRVTLLKKDSLGVVMNNSNYNPTTIFQTGMNSYKYYKAHNDQNAKEVFINQLNWLKNNFKTKDESYGFWHFKTPKPSYNLKSDWTSGLTQGMGLGLALMGYEETKDQKLLEIVDLALKAYLIPINEGGFNRCWDGNIWFEEYPSHEPSRVLNGFIFSIAGLYNVYENTGNELALSLFNEGVKTLEKKIHLYDAEFISKYNLLNKENYSGYAKKSYHRLHIWQLLWLHKITQKDIFYDIAKKFLETQKTQFVINNIRIERVKEVSASSYSAENFASYVNDDNWGWGKYWSSFEDSELSFQFFKPEKIFGFTIFFTNQKSHKIPFDLFAVKSNGSREHIKDIRIVSQIEHKSQKNRTTFINVYNFNQIEDVIALEIKFSGITKKNRISINEVNLFLNLEEDVKRIYNSIQRKIKNKT